MTKRVDSQLAHFPGHVILHDPLSYPLVMKYDEARQYIRIDSAQLAEKYSIPASFDFSRESIAENAKTNAIPRLMDYIEERFRKIQERYYPLIFETVAEWNLENVAPDPRESFPNSKPGTSADEIKELVGWLISECQSVYNGHDDDPNA